MAFHGTYDQMTREQLLERVEALDAARRGEEEALLFAKFALDNASDAVYWIRRDAGLNYVNEAACRMLGYTKEELIQKKVYELNPDISEETWPAVWEALRKLKRRTFEARHQTRHGYIFPVEISANLIEFDDKEYSCTFSRDISERKRAEEALRKEHAFVDSLIETAPVIVLVLDSKGHILRFNSHTTAVVGYSLEEALGQEWFAFIPEAQRDRVRDLFAGTLANLPIKGVVYPILTKRGEKRDILWYDKPLRDSDERIIGILAIGQDVTDQQEMAFRLKQKEKMEAIGQLAGGIAHDFNNQLAGILGYLDILQEELEGDETLCSYLDRMMTAVKRSADLTAQLLAYSRKGKYLSQRVSLHDIVDEVIAMLFRSIDKRIVLEKRFRATSSAIIGDPTQLQNAVLNLALNARDAMPKGGKLSFDTQLIELEDSYCDRNPYEILPGTYVLLTVADTGSGMDLETQRHMFEPYFTTKEKGKGTGMGLAAVYGTVKNHKGAINVYSEIGRGTVVKIYLPADATVGSGEVRAHHEKIVISGPVHVLIVEDEEIFREVAKEMLERIGCRVTVCGNGKEAMALYELTWRDIDVVLLDLVMPLMDGRDAFNAMKQINPDIKAILASGYSLDGEAQSILDAGVAAFVQKPFRRAELIEKIEFVLKRGKGRID